MKKILLVFAFLGLFAFLTPKVADAEEPCHLELLHCTNTGVSYMVVVCDEWDLMVWGSILCGYDD